jgi:hypothetical protein
MKSNLDQHTRSSKFVIFLSIVSSTVGIVVAAALLLANDGKGNKQFATAFGLLMLWMLVSAIWRAHKFLFADKTFMTVANKSNPFLTKAGIIIGTICSTTGLCIFIPMLATNIEKGVVQMIMVSVLIVALQFYAFYKSLRDANKFLQKKEPAMYQHQEFH